MNDQHRNLFNLLIEIDDICSQYDIDYCLAGGTALGAIRNHCFLPWDDDIDLYITRDNWTKLFDLIDQHPEVLPENRNFVCIENEKYHRNPIARYVDTTSTIIYAAQSISAKTCGNQIEFFILDPIPNVEDGREEHLKEMRAFLEILSPYFISSKRMAIQDYAEHKERVFKYYDEIEKRGYDEVMGELYDKLYTYPFEKADTLCLRWGTRTLLHEARFYCDKRYEDLEGREFPVAYELEHALRVDYGDSWMYIPQGEAQLSHNGLVEDLNRPFEDFTKIYLKYIDKEKVTKAYENNKKNNIELWEYKKRMEIERIKMQGVLARKEIEKQIELNNYDLNQLLKDKEFSILNDLFSKYYDAQLNQVSKYHSQYIEMDNDLLKFAIENKIRQGLYYVARNLLDLIEKNTDLSKDLKDLKEICEYCRQLSIAIYDDFDVDRVENLLESSPPETDDLIDTFRAQLWLAHKKAKNNDDYNEIIKTGREMLSQYSDDGEIMAHIAEAYYKLGDTENAREMYDKAVHHTRNGFVWQNAKTNVGVDKMAEEEIDVNKKLHSA